MPRSICFFIADIAAPSQATRFRLICENGTILAGVARQSGWKRCGELDGQFGGRGEEMIVAPRQ